MRRQGQTHCNYLASSQARRTGHTGQQGGQGRAGQGRAGQVVLTHLGIYDLALKICHLILEHADLDGGRSQLSLDLDQLSLGLAQATALVSVCCVSVV